MEEKKIKITREFVREAIKRFQERGGIIKLLPPQEAVRRVCVGSRFAQFEDVLVGSSGETMEVSSFD